MRKDYFGTIIFIISIILVSLSCSNNQYLAHWRNFHKDLMDKDDTSLNFSYRIDQIDWINFDGKLNKNDFINHAKKNSWILVDSMKVYNRLIPLEKQNTFDTIISEVMRSKILPNLATNNAMLYCFSTEYNKINSFLFVEVGGQHYKILKISEH